MSQPSPSAQTTASATTALIGHSPALRSLLLRAEKAAACGLPIVVTGESGTGKELLARYIHDRSRRASGPYVVINCAAIPRELVESELFGYERGAFTGARGAHQGWFQAAHGGTLVLDEIGELPIELQPKLLRALEGGSVAQVGSRRGTTVDVRIVASTNRDLRKECAAGRFREDLHHRLCGITLALPPLRQRLEDLPLLIAHFATRAAAEQGLPVGREVKLSQHGRQRLEEHRWSGNVRELRHLVWRTIALAGVPLDESTLVQELEPAPASAPFADFHARAGASRAADGPAPREVVPSGCVSVANKTLAEMELLVIQHHLRACHGNRRRAARLLGISRTTLYERLRQMGDPAECGQP